MGVIEITHSGNTKNLERFLKAMEQGDHFLALESIGQQGVAALEMATPRDTGNAARSWYYVVRRTPGGATISWQNAALDGYGTPIVIMLQYGHGTGTGGYVAGRDFINPALEPVFRMASDVVWKVVQS